MAVRRGKFRAFLKSKNPTDESHDEKNSFTNTQDIEIEVEVSVGPRGKILFFRNLSYLHSCQQTYLCKVQIYWFCFIILINSIRVIIIDYYWQHREDGTISIDPRCNTGEYDENLILIRLHTSFTSRRIKKLPIVYLFNDIFGILQQLIAYLTVNYSTYMKLLTLNATKLLALLATIIQQIFFQYSTSI